MTKAQTLEIFGGPDERNTFRAENTCRDKNAEASVFTEKCLQSKEYRREKTTEASVLQSRESLKNSPSD
jgi:hypothetical protein